MGDLTGFAKNLKRIREERGLKQTNLATKIKVTPQTISAYEKGSDEKGKNPTLEKAIDIADALGVSLDELCGRERKVETSVKTLGDVARLLCDMWSWITVSFSEQKITEWGFDGDSGSSYETSVPTIIFNYGPLSKFLEDYSKLQKLRKDRTIDDQMFNDWVSLKIRDLDAINVESQKEIIEVSEDDELPF